MPEIQDRLKVDANATQELASLFARQRARLENTPKPGPSEYQQQERELLFLLILLMGGTFYMGSQAALPQLGAAEPVDMNKANAWAIPHARQLSRAIVANSEAAIKAGGNLEAIYGAGRAESIAVTEITRARVAGEKAIRDEIERSGATVVATWRTELDAKVCSVCSPLEGEDEHRWSLDFPAGPPAHPRCRCTLEFTVSGTAQPGNN